MNITILGTGAYGLALAIVLSKNKNNNIIMWTKFDSEKELINNHHVYQKVLPDTIIPSSIKITTNMIEAISSSELIIAAIPVPFIDSTIKELSNYYNNQYLCIASKGIEHNNCLFVDEIISKYIDKDKISIISGGSFAIDTVTNYPIGLTLAGNEKNQNIVEKAFINTNVKLEKIDDITGVEVCSSIKNVVAIACGILDGLKINESTKMMFMTKAIQAIKEFLIANNNNTDVLYTYAGIGDLLLTCTSSKSRNYTFGLILASNNKEEINKYKAENTIEGINTLEAFIKLMDKMNVSISIFREIYDIIFNDKDSKLLVDYLRM